MDHRSRVVGKEYNRWTLAGEKWGVSGKSIASGCVTVTQVTKPFSGNVSKIISLLAHRECYQSPGIINV